MSALPILSPDQISGIASGLGLNPNPFVGATVTGHAEDFKNPDHFSGAWRLSEKLPGLVVGIDYSNVVTSNVQRNRDLNLPAPLTGAEYVAFLQANNTAANFTTMTNNGTISDILRSGRRYVAINSPAGLVFPTGSVSTRPRPTQAQQGFALGPVQVRESSAKGFYRSLTLRARLIRRVQLNAYYTYSQTNSDDDNERDAGGVAFADPYDLSSEYGPARLDRRSQFTANPIFFLPYGFEMSGALRLRTGTPLNANANGDLNGDGVTNDRPLSAPGVPYTRNGFRNYALYDFDARVQKGFKFGENKRLIFSTEFFNLFNRMNVIFPNPGTNTTTAAGQFCAAASQLCGLGGVPTNANFLRARDANGNYINNAAPGSQVFQMQLGVRFQF